MPLNIPTTNDLTPPRPLPPPEPSPLWKAQMLRADGEFGIEGITSWSANDYYRLICFATEDGTTGFITPGNFDMVTFTKEEA